MKKHIQLGLALLLLVVSWPPLFDMLRETWMDGRITGRYEIEHTFERDGFKTTVDTQELTINGLQITIEEIPTGQKAPLTFWDEEEGVPPGDIVRIQYYLNGKAISEADPIWLSNRDRGSRYYSWLDVLSVYDKETDEKYIYIVQRLTDDDANMAERAWKLIRISPEGEVSEETVSYADRSQHPLAVRLINYSGTSLMAMGYHSDILHGYPSLFFPLLYPFLTGVIGLIFLVVAIRKAIKG